MIDIAEVLDAHLASKQNPRGVTAGATWRASKLGSCLRAQYLASVLKVPALKEHDALSLRRFEIGHLWGRMFSDWFREAGLLTERDPDLLAAGLGWDEQGAEYTLYDEELDLGAHADFILRTDDGLLGVELKSMQSRYFWNRKKEGAATTALYSHLVQAGAYDLMCRAKGVYMPWVVVCVSKDDLSMSQDLVTQDHRDQTLGRLNVLNQAKRLGVAPICECLDPGAYEWRYCDYGTAMRGQKTPPAECCVIPDDGGEDN